ncbi:hypothetical protein [Candidatus Regiella endosymbiont of Tuberolachnus salignus]|uniref:hypothetical protein n=1 Tax=Candidatus Regiella endosymbiont of Tuberolachnus salignus TaxID=3077956 RepID=UPI0030CA8D39
MMALHSHYFTKAESNESYKLYEQIKRIENKVPEKEKQKITRIKENLLFNSAILNPDNECEYQTSLKRLEDLYSQGHILAPGYIKYKEDCMRHNYAIHLMSQIKALEIEELSPDEYEKNKEIILKANEIYAGIVNKTVEDKKYHQALLALKEKYSSPIHILKKREETLQEFDKRLPCSISKFIEKITMPQTNDPIQNRALKGLYKPIAEVNYHPNKEKEWVRSKVDIEIITYHIQSIVRSSARNLAAEYSSHAIREIGNRLGEKVEKNTSFKKRKIELI